MGFVNTFTASGQGSLSLGGSQYLNELSGFIITPATFATLTGATGVRRVHQQGWYGVGLTPGGGPTSGLIVMTYWAYITMENWTNLKDFVHGIPADTIYWDIHDGGVMYFEADWP